MTPRASARQASIDVLRAVAIALMVVVHFVENLSGWYGEADNVFAGVHQVWWLPTGFAAPIFTFLAGVSYRLWVGVHERRGLGQEAIAKGTIRRGLFLVGLGFAFNVLIWLPEDVFNWDILTAIGFGLLVLEFARRMPDGVVLFAAVLVVAVAPTLREVAGYSEHWTEGYYDYDFTVSDVALGWLVTGYFPVFPWLAFPLVGYAAAPALLRQTSQPPRAGPAGSPPAPTLRVGYLAASAILASAVLILFWPRLPTWVTGHTAEAWAMFPATTAYVLGTLGGISLVLAVLHRVLDGDVPRCRELVAWATPLSRHALSIYILHHAVHVWPLWAWGLATTGDPSALWQVAMPPWASLSLAVLFLAAVAVFCRWADTASLPTAESLMRWICE